MQSTASFHLVAKYTNRAELLQFRDNEFHLVASTTNRQCRVCCFSSDGKYLAIGGDDGLVVRDLETGVIDMWPTDSSLISAQFSPSAKYFAILSQFSHEKCPQNLTVYEFQTKTKVFACCQKNSKWCLQWSDNEQFACISHKGQLKYILTEPADGVNLAELSTVKCLQSYALSPNETNFIATFCRQMNEKTSSVTIQKFDDSKNLIITVQLNLYNIDECEFKWNYQGTCVLAICQNTNTTKKSYYGESKLFLIDAVQQVKQEVCFSNDDESLNISDCNWSPASDEFCVVFDRSYAAIFDTKVQRLKNLTCNQAVRNGIQYHSSGEFIALTGSGNIKGNFEIWRRPLDGNSKSIKPISGQIEIPYATIFRWCLGGHFLLAATTFPRLRQDNGFHIFNLVGQKLISVKVDDNNLADVIWSPKFDFTITDTDLNTLLQNLKLSKQEQLKSGEIATTPKLTKYIPPHLRGDQNTDQSPLFIEPSPISNKLKSKKLGKKSLPPGLN
ncbi:hypothetical protein GJ496_011328 [Pomphorhynchus laevis]|nr:hypothetical protein GJ496_011328 [Pomphorhynchus laevis]